MRIHNWMFKVITTYTDGLVSTAYFSNYLGVKIHKANVSNAELASFRVFTYGGVI